MTRLIPPPDLDQRSRLLDVMAAEMPLAFTAGIRAMSSWAEDCKSGSITIKSATGRDVAFYVGPARRYFGNPAETLEKGRGRIALLLKRSVIKESWEFAPFDRGELLYHWRHGHIHIHTSDEHGLDLVEKLTSCSRSSDYLQTDFRNFLDEGYENPLDYLCSWLPPRPSLEFSSFANAVYRAGSDRLFGRVRGFAPAWTFEITTSDQPVQVSLKQIIAAVVVEDYATPEVRDLNFFKECLGDRYHPIVLDSGLVHPDLPAVILEAATSSIIRSRLKTFLDGEQSRTDKPL